MQEFKNLIVEQTIINNDIEVWFKSELLNGYVIYFEENQNKELSIYIKNHYADLKKKFASLGLNFIYAPLIPITSKKIEDIVSYYFPQLNYYQIPQKVGVEFNEKMLSQIFTKFQEEIEFISDKNEFVPNQVEAKEILTLIEYKGSIKSGLIFLNTFSGIIGVSDYFYSNETSNYDTFFEDVLNYLQPENEDFALGDFMLGSFLPMQELTEQLDEETKAFVKDIEGKLDELRDTGQLLFLIPILKDLLNKQSEKIDFRSISKMKINYQNKILLPYFKKEVELSHLTKAIYFLFLKHPEGINLKELGKHKKELLTIYTSVSNQLDYDKMSKSIDDVIDIETKAIYTHLSRIKSAYYKIMDASFAKYYIVSGSGEEERKVLFNTNDIDWNNDDRFNPETY
jgi:hypothetical protein